MKLICHRGEADIYFFEAQAFPSAFRLLRSSEIFNYFGECRAPEVCRQKTLPTMDGQGAFQRAEHP